MVTNVKVSVIVPVFNKEEFIEECLEKLIAQSLKEIEIICVNDGSTDRSEEIIKRYAQADERIVLFTQENQGVAKARNAGIRIAHGEFVAFMDPDDVYPSLDVLEYLYNAAKEHDVLVAGGSLAELHGDEVITDLRGIRAKYRFEQDGVMDYRDYQFDYGFTRFIYNANMLRENNICFPMYIRFQDPPFFVRAMTTAGRFYASTKTVYYYRLGFQKLVWTPKRLLCWAQGLRDNVLAAVNGQYEELYNTCFWRIGESLLPVLREKYDEITLDLIKTLLECFAARPYAEIKGNTRTAERYMNAFCLIHAAFFVHREKWADTPETELREIAARLEEIERHICSECETPENGQKKLKSRYAIEWSERKTYLTEDKGLYRAFGEDVKTPAVSVIIPVYNVEQYLRACLESIIHQTLKDIEIICVNDGSPDHSMDILMEYARKDSRINIYCQKNGGLSEARNAGAKNSKGKYIYFMDSDDILEVDALKLLFERAENDNLDVVCFNAYAFSDEDKLKKQVEEYNGLYTRKHDYACPVYEKTTLLKELLEQKEYIPSAWLQFTKREHFLRCENWFIRGICHEDEFFTFKNMLMAQRSGYMDRVFFRRRVRENSIMTSRKTFANAYGCFVSYLEMQRMLYKTELDEQKQNCVYQLMHRILHACQHAFRQIEENEKYTVMGLSQNERRMFAMLIEEKDAEHAKVLTLKQHMDQARENSRLARQKIENAWELNAQQKKRLEQAWEMNAQNKKKFNEQNELLRDRLNKVWGTNKQAKERLQAAWDANKQVKEKLQTAWEQNAELKKKLQAAWDANKQAKEKLQTAWEQNAELKKKLQAAWDANKENKEKLENAWNLNAQMKKQIEQLKKKKS